MQVIAYVNFKDDRLPYELNLSLHKCNVTPCQVPKGKNATNKVIIGDIHLFAFEYLPPFVIMLTSGDADFTLTLNCVYDWRHNTVLVIPFGVNVSDDLKKGAHYVWK